MGFSFLFFSFRSGGNWELGTRELEFIFAKITV
jgi:hypothetical protein